MSAKSPAAGPAASTGDPAPASNSAIDEAGAPDSAPARRRPAATPVAFVLALLATVAAGTLWWQYRGLRDALRAADVELDAGLEGVRADQRGLADRVEALQAALVAERERSDRLADGVRDLPSRFAELERELDPLPSSFVELRRRLDALQGGSADARAAWLRAEAEYFLSVANTELELAGRWSNAAKALQLADDRLRALSDPAMTRVRERIADELLALGSVDPPDVDGVVLTLARLAERVEALPLRPARPQRDERHDGSLDDAEPGLSRLALSLRSALSGIVSIERNDERSPPLSAERRALAKRELALELQLARIAALRGHRESFASSLNAAMDLIERDFDMEAAAVGNALELLGDLLGVDIAPPRPDISRSLNLLRSVPAGNG